MDDVYIQGDKNEAEDVQAENWRLKADISELENDLDKERRDGHKARIELSEYKEKYKRAVIQGKACKGKEYRLC